jgi:hypothetical protein
MTFESQGKIAQTLITIILTALGTLMFQCAKYAFFDYPRDIAQVRQNDQYELKRISILWQNYSEFQKAVHAALARADQRVEKLSAITGLGPLDLKKLEKVHAEAAQYAIEANNDYGKLQSFAVEDKLLSQPIRDTLAREATMDLEFWQLLFNCSRPGITQREIIVCNDDLTRAKFGINREATGYDQLTFNESMMQIDSDRESQQYKSTEYQMLRSYIGSIIGFIASLIAYYIILTRNVTPGAVTQKLEAQKQMENAISEDKQAGDTNLNKDV